jgi:CRISP-associated protein Cas1
MTPSDSSSENQLPARMINEMAYCPRLFYLEYVQREWAESVDTLDGRFVHRRVDRKQGAMPTADELSPDSRLHSRSITVGSERLGAIAIIDLIETTDGRVVPVDYKRGSAPDITEGAWEPERVQVCLQGLLLRDNGYLCDYGILYFAESQSRVTVDFTDPLIERTFELLDQARRLCQGEQIPPPLRNSNKCPRCSLVGICLPDETNLLHDGTFPLSENAQAAAEEPQGLITSGPTAKSFSEPRRLTPARDDRMAIYVQGQGFSIGLKGEVLEIRDKGKAIDEARLLEVAQLSIFGNVQLSAQALRELASRSVPIIHMSYSGWLSAITTPPPHKNIELRRRQFRSADDPAFQLTIARAIVAGKIRNQRTLLRRNSRDLPDGLLHRLAESRRRAGQATSLEQLLGIEGSAARDYFANFPLMFKPNAATGTTDFNFESRNRRPPRDPVNALLSFLYAMLVKDLVVTLVGVGFDPYLGFYHKPRYGRPALALDLMEEFRPLVADSVAIGMINNGEIRPIDFIYRAGACALTDSGRKRVLEAYERRLDSFVIHPIFGYAVSYRRVFEVQARLLSRLLQGEIPHYPSFTTR